MPNVFKEWPKSNLFLSIFVSSAVIIADTLLQHWVFSSLGNENALVVTPFFRLVQVWNTGVSFGMFNGLAYGQVVLSVFSLMVCMGLLWLLLKTKDRIHAVAYALIIGGGLGNILDRSIYGAVADYLDFHVLDYHWPAFNVTDSAVFIGVAILLWTTVRSTPHIDISTISSK